MLTNLTPSKAILFGFIYLSSFTANAQWSSDPAANTPVSAALSQQEFPKLVSDGAGGAIITWRDFRGGLSLDIYAQRIDATGNVVWTTGGIPICTATGDQLDPSLTSDGAGGAIIAWSDNRFGTFAGPALFAQRIDAGGNSLWAADGVQITPDSTVSGTAVLLADGLGGAFIAWTDIRQESGITGDIYAQHLNAAGAEQWTTDGIAVCGLLLDQGYPVIVSDNTGGAIIAWEDARDPFDINIYAQRVNSTGAIQWTADGVKLSTGLDHDRYPVSVANGSGGAIIAWLGSGSNSFVYAQNVDASGIKLWAIDGARVDTTNYYSYKPQICSDGSGGAFVTWESLTTVVSARRIDAAGTVQGAASTPVTSTTFTQKKPQIVSDEMGGAMIVWQDERSGFFNTQLYAQNLSGTGSVMWEADAALISSCTTAPPDEDYDYNNDAQMIADGNGGAIVTWMRYGATNDFPDVYAQLIGPGGISPPLVTAINSPNTLKSSIQNKPNPFKGKTAIEFSIENPSQVKISVINMFGQEVAMVLNSNLSVGKHTINYDASDLATGVYSLQLHTSSGISSTQMVITR